MEHDRVEDGGKRNKPSNPTVFLDADVIEGFDALEVGGPIRLELRGTLIGKRDPDETSSSRFAELSVDSATVLRRITDREAERLSDDELDEAVEKEFHSRASTRSS